MQIVMILVFSIVLLIFMIYPAMKIVEYLEKFINISDKMYDFLTVAITIALSLIFGVGLYFL
ncbi:hypothetical protein [Malaciobacter mytili]|uniref:Uncharacterized protein n=1 Tax=Malaciobacter mytili LMG 24559 TaxID=1032238 RepID=A0AAX2AJY1_9BACT|nr:hypothetical protein [Malaciobacter mytili]AXH14066.1 putative membrane protein [Malaciobacter mytili LMG 24559]RXK16945.1 hypothetical protein CP985_00560 [Malaciobacter mytili LMG 24559]